MNDDDLIRRGDAVLAVTAADKECLGANGAREFIRALPAAPTFTAADLERAYRLALQDLAKPVYAWSISAAEEIEALPIPADLAQRVKKGPAHD